MLYRNQVEYSSNSRVLTFHYQLIKYLLDENQDEQILFY